MSNIICKDLLNNEYIIMSKREKLNQFITLINL